eukprot:670756-Prorocentrum_minimum.AAC.1
MSEQTIHMPYVWLIGPRPKPLRGGDDPPALKWAGSHLAGVVIQLINEECAPFSAWRHRAVQALKGAQLCLLEYNQNCALDEILTRPINRFGTIGSVSGADY